jgi:hypothetical protein
VENRRPITEEDIYLTELLIGQSYGRLKESVGRASSGAFSSMGDAVGNTVRTHPYAAAGVAVGAGVLLFGIFSMMNRTVSSKRESEGSRKRSSRSGIPSQIFSLILPLVAPYFAAYLEKIFGRIASRDQN